MVRDNYILAAESLKKGMMILIYDGDEREGEADLVIGGRFIKPEVVRKLRKDAGGLICQAIPKEGAERLGLPFMTDILESAGGQVKALSCLKTAYGDRPAFSIAVNHKGVYTGITDNDRSLTIRS